MPVWKNVRSYHRIVGTVVGVLALYIAITGLIIQGVDLKAVLSHTSETDPSMIAIRESIDGTSNFSVIQPTDYAAPALPQDFDFTRAFSDLLMSARSAFPSGTPIKSVEVRMLGGTPTGIVRTGTPSTDSEMSYVDLATHARLPAPPPSRLPGAQSSMHNRAKQWHRFQFIPGIAGDMIGLIHALIGLALFFMVISGLVLYFRLLRARRRSGLRAVFWFAADWWRSLHRIISVLAAIFLIVVSGSGTLLALDTFALGMYGATHMHAGKYARWPAGMIGDFSSPLSYSEIPRMLATTLSAYHADEGSTPVKVLRLRYFAGMPQGLILTGGADTRQLVYNASTGARAHMTEPGYPYTGFPFGWREHELMKQIHRGDALGMPGRLLDVFAGLSLIFLSISGLWMYVDTLRKRKRAGRSELFWA